jgi:hypothetical protein
MQPREGVAPKQYPPNPPPAAICDTATCEIKVTVSLAGGQCNIAVDKTRANVGRGPANKKITWTLEPSAVHWPNPPADPILPVQFDLNAVGVISNLTVSGNKVTVDYMRPSVTGNKYGYSVFVKTTLPQPVCGIDPWLED